MFSAPGFSVKSALFFLPMCSMNKFAYFGPEPLVNLFCYEFILKNISWRTLETDTATF